MRTPNLDKLENAKGRDQIALCIIYWADPQTASKENIEEAEQAATEFLKLRATIAEQESQLDNLIRFMIGEGLVKVDDMPNSEATKEAIAVMMGMQNKITEQEARIEELEKAIKEFVTADTNEKDAKAWRGLTSTLEKGRE